MAIEVRPVSPALGAEVIGADLTRPDDDAQFQTIHQALLDHNVVVIRDQDISPADHAAFSARFGELELHVLNQFLLPEQPEVLVLSNKHVNGVPVGLQDAGREWHSDLSYMRLPSLGSLLYALESRRPAATRSTPTSTRPTDTLSPGLKERIKGLRLRHSYADFINRRFQESAMERPTLTAEQAAKVPTAIHPLVRTHPNTGRKALYVSPSLVAGIDGMDNAEGQALLQELNEHATQPRFVYRHVWRLHDIVFWDNRCTLHQATAFDPQYTRHMHRTTIRGGPAGLTGRQVHRA